VDKEVNNTFTAQPVQGNLWLIANDIRQQHPLVLADLLVFPSWHHFEMIN